MKKILAFAKRDLKNHFDHPGGYVVFVVFLGLSLFLYFRSTLVVSEASLRPLFSILPWLLLFLVSAVTMRSLAADEKEGVTEVFLSEPVTPLQYVIGKYLGALVISLSGVFLTIPVLLVLARFGPFDWGLVIAQYLGTVLLVGAMTAIGFFASGLTKNQIVAFIVSIAILFFFVILGWEAALGSISLQFADFIQRASILWHFSNITRGVIDLRDALYFISLTLIFLSFAYAGFMRSRLAPSSSQKKRLRSWTLALVILALIWNIAAQFIPLRLDLTGGHLYTLSGATKRIVKSLQDPVTITLYSSENLPSELAIAKRDVLDMLNDYRSIAKGKVVLE